MIALLAFFSYPFQLLANIIAACVEGKFDGETVLKGRWPEHKLSATIRVVINLLVVYFVDYKLFHYSYLDCTLVFIPSLALYWTFLDLSINITRDKEYFYIGKTATTDKIVRSISKWLNKLSPGTGIDGEHVFLVKLFIVIASTIAFYHT